MKHPARRLAMLLLCAAAFAPAAIRTAAAQVKRIAITSFGEHPALQQTIDGLKDSMKDRGFIEGRDVAYTFTHVNWERNLIPQMLAKIAAEKPDVVVTITTPVTQVAVRAISDPAVPVVFAAVQDPVIAGVVPAWDRAAPNMTGASNLIDMDGTLRFIRELLPNAKRVGVPFNPGDDADNALRERLVAAAAKHGFELVLVPVDTANDIPQRLQTLSGKVDAVYVLPTNLFQPITAQIAAITTRLGLPAFSGVPAPVQQGQMLGSYSVDYVRIGVSAAAIVERVLKGEKVAAIPPTVPTPADHVVVISQSQTERWKVSIPAAYAGCTACLLK